MNGLQKVKKSLLATKEICLKVGLEKCKNFSLVDGLNLALRQIAFVERGVKNEFDSGNRG